MNRGFDILPAVAADLNMVLGESIFADYDFTTKSGRLFGGKTVGSVSGQRLFVSGV
jgi:hypothetical protein